MAYTAFILDDEPDAVAHLQNLLKSYSQLRVVGTESNPAKAIPLIRSNRPDLLFLDIEMPGFTGFEIIERVKDDIYSPVIVFVTGFNNYAIDAIRHSVFDYLLKPVIRAELDNLIEKFIRLNPVYSCPDAGLRELLTSREYEIFEYLRRGSTSFEISVALNISSNTVDTHRRNIIKKLGFSSTREIMLRYPAARGQ